MILEKLSPIAIVACALLVPASAFSGPSYTGVPPKSTAVTLADGSVLVGSSGGLQFHLIWDSDVSSAPANFKQAAEAAAFHYTQMYANVEVINISVGWGEAGGIPIASGVLAASVRPGMYRTYAEVLAGLVLDHGKSTVQTEANASLPATSPLPARYYYVTFAEAKTLGFITKTGAEVDGNMGMSDTVSLDFSQPVAAGYFDAIGAFEHEISAIMGRLAALGAVYGAGLYTPLDLFRFSSRGVRATTIGAAAPYLSINDGVTNLGNYSTESDYGDWNYQTVRGDAYGGASEGTTLVLTPNDLIENAILGYDFTAAGLAAAGL